MESAPDLTPGKCLFEGSKGKGTDKRVGGWVKKNQVRENKGRRYVFFKNILSLSLTFGKSLGVLNTIIN